MSDAGRKHSLNAMENKDRNDKRICLKACSLILILLGIFCIVQIFFVPNLLTDFLHSEVTKRLVITPEIADPNSDYYDFYQIWEYQRNEGAGIGRFTYFVFNVTNPIESANGLELPQIDMIGPYVYTRYEKRNNITWKDDDTKVEYTYTYEFDFEPELSTDVPLDAKIYCISGQMIVFLRNPLIWGIPTAVEKLAEWPAEYIYAHETIETFLRGYVDERLAEITGLDTPIAFVNNDPIGVEEWTGYPDENLPKIRELIRYRDNPFQQWGDDAVTLSQDPITSLLGLFGYITPYGVWQEYCNSSRESGRQWQPEEEISQDDILTIFAPEKFRKVQYSFEKEVEVDGLDLYRYRINDDEWWTSTLHPESNNFVFGQDGPFDGVMRLDWARNTQNDETLQRLPIMLSKGLFLGAPEYQENITEAYGLPPPIEEWDDQYIDVEPVSGTAFRVHNSYMITLQVNPIEDNPNFQSAPPNFTSNFSNLPSQLWIPQQYIIAEAFAQDSTIAFFVDRLNLVNGLKYTSWIAGPILGCILIVIGMAIWIKRVKRNEAMQYGLMKDNGASKLPNNSMMSAAATSGYGSRDEIAKV